MNEILLITAHPRFEKSRANKAMLAAAEACPFVTVHDLYELYPEFDIDVRREQEMLLGHRILIWQFPLYMYGPPALLKQWIDLVFEYGWAHGSGGTNLEGKPVLTAVTTGGSRDAYGAGSFNRFSLQEFLRPLEQTAFLCGMHWLPVFLVQGTYRLSQSQLDVQAAQYREALERLVSGEYSSDHSSFKCPDRMNHD